MEMPPIYHDIKIRDYQPDDLMSLVDLFRGSVRKIARRDYTDKQVLAWAPDHINQEAFGRKRRAKPTWIAEIKGQIAGFIDLEPDGHIDMLYVHANFQSQGIARLLLDHVEKIAAEDGLARLYTEASLTARWVFERHGFYIVAEQKVQTGGEEFVNFSMEKKLVHSSNQVG